MKEFIVQLPNKNIDSKGFLKHVLLHRIANKYPFLTMDGIDGPETESSIQYAGSNDFLTFGLHPKYHVSTMKKSQWYEPTYKCNNAFNCPFCPLNHKPEKYNLLSDFDIAMKKLDEYAKSVNKPLDKGYDYKWFGLPVRIYQNFVQIGYTIIPKNNGMYILPSNLTEEQITTITNVIVNINIIINE